MPMYTNLALMIITAASLCTAACGPCSQYWDGTEYDITNELLAGGDNILRNGSTAVGHFDIFSFSNSSSYSYASSSLAFWVSRSAIQEAVGILTYTLEVYSGQSSCPPDPATRLRTVDTAPDTEMDAAKDAYFSFAASDLKSFDGTVMVLRAKDPALEPTAAVLCTQPLSYSVSRRVVCGHG